MNFIDEAEIKIKAGDGGSGLVAFRKERGAAKGGPSGGDGGKGGDIIIISDPNLNTLVDFVRNKTFTAEDGQDGKVHRQTGKNGQDLILKVPLGTLIYEFYNSAPKLLVDLSQKNQKLLVTKGGRGGWGNYHFATAVRQTPKFAYPGKPGQIKNLKLELKLLADVGIIGFPNSGKSTLLKAITAAKPKIADYPFTTLIPNLGVVKFNGSKIIIADIPGLIKNAHQGKGLGIKFLKHAERTKILIHILDITSNNLLSDFSCLRKELKLYNPALVQKIPLVALNKIDLVPKKILNSKLFNFRKKYQQISFYPISAKNHLGIKNLLNAIIIHLKKKT